MKIALILIAVLCSYSLAAQDDKLAAIISRLEKYMEYRESELDFSELSGTIENLLQHPLDINKAGAGDLQALFFLSEIQITNLLKHRQHYGDLLSLLELQLVPGWDEEILSLCVPFLTVACSAEKISLKDALKKSRGEFTSLIAWSAPRGPEYQNPALYKGSSLRSLSKMKLFYSNRFSAGISGEKDAGEAFNFKAKPGYDFLSAHFYYAPRRFIQAFIIGDYQLSFGQGLSLASGMSLGKSADIKSLARNLNGFRPYRSVNESNFLRGIALLFGKKNLKSNLCLSSLRIDGSEENDGSFSISESGYHRNGNELEKRKQLRRSLLSFNSSYQSASLLFGINLCLSKTAKATDITARGMKGNAGIYYRYVIRNFSFSGEIASADARGLACIQSILASLGPYFDLCLFYRNYSASYSVTFANSISSSASYNAEKGFYAGFSMKLKYGFQLNVYYDLYFFPSLAYLVDAPSRGRDYLAELKYQSKRQLQLLLRIKSDAREKNVPDNNEAYDPLNWQERKSLRIQLGYMLAPFLEYRCRFEKMGFRSDQPLEKAYLLFHDFIFKPLEKKYSLTFRIAGFSGASWYARIYSYENEMPNAYTITSFSEKQLRSYLLLNYNFSKRLESWLKLANTSYLGFSGVDSEAETESLRKLEIKFQVCIRF